MSHHFRREIIFALCLIICSLRAAAAAAAAAAISSNNINQTDINQPPNNHSTNQPSALIVQNSSSSSKISPIIAEPTTQGNIYNHAILQSSSLNFVHDEEPEVSPLYDLNNSPHQQQDISLWPALPPGVPSQMNAPAGLSPYYMNPYFNTAINGEQQQQIGQAAYIHLPTTVANAAAAAANHRNQQMQMMAHGAKPSTLIETQQQQQLKKSDLLPINRPVALGREETDAATQKDKMIMSQQSQTSTSPIINYQTPPNPALFNQIAAQASNNEQEEILANFYMNNPQYMQVPSENYGFTYPSSAIQNVPTDINQQQQQQQQQFQQSPSADYQQQFGGGGYFPDPMMQQQQLLYQQQLQQTGQMSPPQQQQQQQQSMNQAEKGRASDNKPSIKSDSEQSKTTTTNRNRPRGSKKSTQNGSKLSKAQLISLIDELKDFNSRQASKIQSTSAASLPNYHQHDARIIGLNQIQEAAKEREFDRDDDQMMINQLRQTTRPEEGEGGPATKFNADDVKKFAKFLMTKEGANMKFQLGLDKDSPDDGDEEDDRDALLETRKKPAAVAINQSSDHEIGLDKKQLDLINQMDEIIDNAIDKSKEQDKPEEDEDSENKTNKNKSKKKRKKKVNNHNKDDKDSDEDYEKDDDRRKRRQNEEIAKQEDANNDNNNNVGIKKDSENSKPDHNHGENYARMLLKKELLEDKQENIQDASVPNTSFSPSTSDKKLIADGKEFHRRSHHNHNNNNNEPRLTSSSSPQAIKQVSIGDAYNEHEQKVKFKSYPISQRKRDYLNMLNELSETREKKSRIRELAPLMTGVNNSILKRALDGELGLQTVHRPDGRLVLRAAAGANKHPLMLDLPETKRIYSHGRQKLTTSNNNELNPAELRVEQNSSGDSVIKMKNGKVDEYEYPISEKVSDRLNKLSNNLDKYFNDGFLQEIETKSKLNNNNNDNDSELSMKDHHEASSSSLNPSRFKASGHPKSIVADNSKQQQQQQQDNSNQSPDHDFDVDVGIDGKRDVSSKEVEQEGEDRRVGDKWRVKRERQPKGNNESHEGDEAGAGDEEEEDGDEDGDGHEGTVRAHPSTTSKVPSGGRDRRKCRKCRKSLSSSSSSKIKKMGSNRANATKRNKRLTQDKMMTFNRNHGSRPVESTSTTRGSSGRSSQKFDSTNNNNNSRLQMKTNLVDPVESESLESPIGSEVDDNNNNYNIEPDLNSTEKNKVAASERRNVPIMRQGSGKVGKESHFFKEPSNWK